VIAANKLPLSVAELRSLIDVRPDQTTLWLTLRARSEDRALPALIVNALAGALVNMSPAAGGLPGEQSQAYLGAQIRQVEEDLTSAQERLAAAERGLAGTRDPIVQRSYQEQIAQQRAYTADLRTVLARLYELYQASFTNQITLVEPAAAPQPVATNRALAALLAALAGALATTALVLAFAYFDHLIRTPQDLEDALGVPLLGVVGKHRLSKAKKRSPRATAQGGEYYKLGEQRL
jgi:uncharacterized protein involved in exopolysaccharide biosynthesis